MVGLLSNKSYSKQFLSPYSAQSLWKATPVSPVLGAANTIPLATNYPFITDALNYGTPLYYATANDPPMTFSGGAYMEDELVTRNLVIPHFPANVITANGGSVDSQLALFDSVNGVWY